MRDDKGRLRAELAVLQAGTKDEGPALRFFDADGNVASLLNGEVFTIFTEGGGDNQATFGKHGLQFGDGEESVFVAISTENKVGKLQINDYRKQVYASVLPEDLAKLHTAKP